MHVIRMFLIGCLTSILSGLAAAPANAQLNDPCGCNAGLAPEVTRFSSDKRIQLSFLHQIDQRQYEELKRSANFSGNFMSIISESSDYADFRRERAELFSTVQYSLEEQESVSLLFSTVKTDSWSICKRECIRRQAGFFCDVNQVTKERVAISCSWRPEGTAAKRRVNVVANTKKLPSEWIEPNTTKDWQFERNSSGDFLITFTLDDGSSQTIKLAAIPAVRPKQPQPVKFGSCIGRGGVQGVHFWGPEGEYCNGIEEWGRYATLSTKPAPARICSCTGHGGVEGVRLWGPEGETCGGIEPWGKYDKQCVSAPTITACACMGRGGIGRQVVWGPKDAACGGMANNAWGKYDQFCVSAKIE